MEPVEKEKKGIVKIFWTGGWDSTFRILQLLLVEKRKVQPYYILDPGRKSVDAELKAMDYIKDQLFHKFPSVKEHLLPTIVKNVYEIEPNQEVTAAYRELLKQQSLGTQYEFMARFCMQEGIDNVELSVENSPTGFLPKLIRSHVTEVNHDDHLYYKIDDNIENIKIYTLFKYFLFPILSITKLDMKDIAEKEGFIDLMELTWFCHNPRKYGDKYEPCGVCHPCIDVMAAGMGRRMPLRSKIRYYFRVHDRVMALLHKCPKLFTFVRKRKQQLVSIPVK